MFPAAKFKTICAGTTVHHDRAVVTIVADINRSSFYIMNRDTL